MVKNSQKLHQAAARPFISMAIAGIIAGGMLSAFLAGQPSRDAMWAIAFLVLVVGVGQLALGYVLTLVKHTPNPTMAATTAALYNFACFAVIIGTLQKTDFHFLVFMGSAVLLLSLLAHMQLASGLPKSLWRTLYYAVMAILIVSIPIGIFLSVY